MEVNVPELTADENFSAVEMWVTQSVSTQPCSLLYQHIGLTCSVCISMCTFRIITLKLQKRWCLPSFAFSPVSSKKTSHGSAAGLLMKFKKKKSAGRVYGNWTPWYRFMHVIKISLSIWAKPVRLRTKSILVFHLEPGEDCLGSEQLQTLESNILLIRS